MARFKSVRQKEKRYVFDFLANKGDDNPAAAIFARFPMLEEDFTPKPKKSVFDGINFEKLGKGDEEEKSRLMSALVENIAANMAKVDYEYFVRECIDHFDNFDYDGKEIKTVDDFMALPVEMWTVIANDCYRYAMTKDDFSMGESEPS